MLDTLMDDEYNKINFIEMLRECHFLSSLKGEKR